MKYYFAILLLILVIFVLPGSALGAYFGAAQEYSLRQGQKIADDLYAAGASVAIVGEVEGDAQVVGGNIFLGSSVGKDAEFLGGTVDVIGNVGEDLRVISGKTLFKGEVGKDIAVATGDFSMLPESKVGGDVFMAGGKGQFDGEIDGDLRGIFGNVTINGTIKGNVSITADSVTVGPGAVVDGQFTYSSSKEASIDPAAKIMGKVNYTKADTKSKAQRLLPTLWGTWIFIKFIVLLISALIIQGIFRSISKTFVETAMKSPGWSLVRGFLFLVAVPVVIGIIFLTFIGIPFVILGLSAYTLTLVLAYLFNPIIIGAIVYKFIFKTATVEIHWKSILLGVFIVMALTPIGIIGSILQILIFLLSLGAIYHVLFERFAVARL